MIPSQLYKTGLFFIGKLREAGFFEKVVEQRNQGIVNSQQIAENLGIEERQVEYILGVLYKEGVLQHITIFEREPHKKQERKKEEIKALRLQGFENYQIAQELTISEISVRKMVTQVIKEKKIKPQNTPHEEIEQLKMQVIELRGQGFTKKKIAEKLEQPEYRIGNIIHSLIQQGILKPLK